MDREFKHGVPESREVNISSLRKVYAFFDNPFVMLIAFAIIIAIFTIWRGGHVVHTYMPPLR